MKHDLELTARAVAVFTEKTERDKQRLVGASNFSSPCNKCLAEDMLGIDREEHPFVMGAIIGTAIHGLAEERLRTTKTLQEMFNFPLVEEKLILGEIPGYGVIKSTTDLYVPVDNLAWDWKTTTRDKLEKIDQVIEADLEIDPDHYPTRKYEELMGYVFKVKTYINQTHTYAKACIDAGHPVDYVVLAFVCRDAVKITDVKVYKFKYDPDLADRVWGRVVKLWELLESGKTPDNFESHPFCWYCSQRR